MVVTARMEMRHARCVSQALAGGAAAAQISHTERGDLYVVETREEGALDAYLASLGPVFGDTLRVLSREGPAALYLGVNPAYATASVVDAAGCQVLWPLRFGDGRQRFRVAAPTREHLRRLVGELETHGTPTVSHLAEAGVATLAAHSSFLGELLSGLTARQAAVLSFAVQHGHYETPRRVRHEEIARAFSVSRSTVEEHLRKAEREVLRRVAEMMQDPMAAQVRPKGPGRPRRPPAGRADP